MQTTPKTILILLAAGGLALAGCASPTGITPRGLSQAALPMDLSRFMGDWFVIAHIPTSVEAEAYEALESYALRDDGEIDVLYRFCEGALDGPAQELTMRAWVHDPATNAEWRVRPVWPLRLQYQILELDPDYSVTVIGYRTDNAWVMARTPSFDDGALAAIEQRLAERGYDTEKLRRVPHGDASCRTGS